MIWSNCEKIQNRVNKKYLHLCCLFFNSLLISEEIRLVKSSSWRATNSISSSSSLLLHWAPCASTIKHAVCLWIVCANSARFGTCAIYIILKWCHYLVCLFVFLLAILRIATHNHDVLYWNTRQRFLIRECKVRLAIF